MCLGTPFQVIAVREGFVEGQDSRGHKESLNTALIEPPAIGEWVLGFLGSAIESLSPDRAREMNEAHAVLYKIREGVAIEPTDFSFALPSQIDPQQLKNLTGQA